MDALNILSKSEMKMSEKRKSIVDAAISEFCSRGYEGTSMDRIAEVSGASKRTVYNHFPSKELLFQEIATEFARAMSKLKQIQYNPQRGLHEQLVEFVQAEIALLNDPSWKGFTRTLLAALVRDPELAQRLAKSQGEHENSLETWIKAACQDGKLQVADIILAAKVFAAMIGGAFSWPAVYQGQIDLQAAIPLRDELIRTFLQSYKAI